ncbi:MAG: hypothetical protein AB1593_10220 [Pseudomonadota bacterium]
MLADIVWILVILAGGAGFYFFFRRKAARAAAVSRVPRARAFHCVEIQGDGDACSAARRIEGQRFLSGEAPGLPVPGCSHAHCTCSYVHHDDRRQDDRRNPYGQWVVPPSITGERRTRVDRRRSGGSGFRPSISIG